MRKYEVMMIVKPDLNDEERKNVFNQINDAITKMNGEIVSCGLWSEKRRLFFPLKKYREGVYYLVSFNLEPAYVSRLSASYRLNENILRALITNREV